MTCSRCRASDVGTERLSVGRRVTRWLTHGRPAPDVEATCRQCGHTWETTAQSTTYLYRVSDSWWRKPQQLLSLPLRLRTWQPNPALYLGSAITGTAVGLLLDVLWGVPWWVLTVAGPVAVLVLSVVSVVRHSGARSLRMELLSVLEPARHRERQLEEQARLVRETDLPLYMPADAHGWFRHVGRMSHSDDQLNGLSLSHERQDGAGDAEVDIETRRGRLTSRTPPGFDPQRAQAHEERANRQVLIHWLAERITRPDEPPPQDGRQEWAERRRQRIQDAQDQLQQDRWRTRSLQVDGQMFDFDVLEAAGSWVATTRLNGGLHLNVRARGIDIDAISLVSVQNVQSYLDGARQTK